MGTEADDLNFISPCSWCHKDATGEAWEFGLTVLCQMCWEAHCGEAYWEEVRVWEQGGKQHPAMRRRFESRMDARGSMRLEDATREDIAAFLHAVGERPCFSNSIADTLTCGYGQLDDYGFWEFPLRALEEA